MAALYHDPTRSSRTIRVPCWVTARPLPGLQRLLGARRRLTPLRRIRTERRGREGQWRFYNVYAVPDDHGGGTIRLRLDQTDHDRDIGFNREEHLRVIPPDDPDHPVVYGRRNDTESGNRLLDDSMLRERAHTVGWRRQLVNVTCWAAVRNAVAVWQHCPDCVGLDPPAAA